MGFGLINYRTWVRGPLVKRSEKKGYVRHRV